MNTVLFDLDGTLLPMEIETFIKIYMGALKNKFESLKLDGEKCVKCVFAGTKAMYKNDGSLSNEDCFWQTFETLSGIERKYIEPKLDVFYREEFPNLQCSDKKSENMIEAVSVLKEKGYRLILSTNPLFPKLATFARVGWAGLSVNDFDVITTYENCHYTKPNIKYYEEVLSLANVNANDCMMVGNDTLEDGIVETMHIPVYLVEDYLIERENTNFNVTYKGSSKAFLAFVKALPEVKENENC